MAITRRHLEHWPWRIALWCVVLFVGALGYLQNNPWRLKGETPALSKADSPAARIEGEAQADVVLLLDYDRIESSQATFESRDWSAAWVGLLAQEVGPISIATPQSWSTQLLRNARVIIVSASVSQAASPALITAIRQHAELGDLVILDRPSGALRQAFSANGHAGLRRAQAVTFFRDLDEDFLKHIEAMPLVSEYLGSTGARDGAQTLMSVDGAPVIYALDVGQGSVVTIDFDLGEQLVAMQQGKPSPNFEVIPTFRKPEMEELHNPSIQSPKTSDLVSDPRLNGALLPYADLLERLVTYGLIMPYAGLPVLWPFPDLARGVVIGLHPNEGLGDQASWMLDFEHQHGGRASLLMNHRSALTKAGAQHIRAMGGDIGLLWHAVDTPAQYVEPLAFGPFHPLAKPTSLSQQLDALEDTIGRKVKLTQRAGAWWDRSWDAPFLLLQAEEITVDTSYIPAETSGFSFGTGSPFLAFSRRGLPLDVYELPVVFPAHHDDDDDERMRKVLELSSSGFHITWTLSIDPARFAAYPDLDRFQHLVDLLATLKEQRHQLMSVGQYLAFQRARQSSGLTSRWEPVKTLPRAEFAKALTSVQAKSLHRLVVRVQAKSSRLAVAAPRRIQGLELVFADRAAKTPDALSDKPGDRNDSPRVTSSNPLTIMGFPIELLPLEKGPNHFSLYYTTPPTDEVLPP